MLSFDDDIIAPKSAQPAAAAGTTTPVATSNRVNAADKRVINGTTGTVTRVEPENTGYARLTVAIGSRSISFSTTDSASMSWVIYRRPPSPVRRNSSLRRAISARLFASSVTPWPFSPWA